MTNNLCYVLYDDYAIIGEYTLNQEYFNIIEKFAPEYAEEYIKEWFPNGLKLQQYIDMRATIRYAQGGIISDPHTKGWIK